MRGYLVIITIIITLSITGCRGNNSIEIEETKDKGFNLMTHENYPMEQAKITMFGSTAFHVNIREWGFIDDNMIHILTDDNREFLVDKTNVILFSTSESDAVKKLNEMYEKTGNYKMGPAGGSN